MGNLVVIILVGIIYLVLERRILKLQAQIESIHLITTLLFEHYLETLQEQQVQDVDTPKCWADLLGKENIYG